MNDCEFDVKTLCDILHKLPLLETLELHMILIFRHFSIEYRILISLKLPKLLNLKDFKMEINIDTDMIDTNFRHNK